MAQLPTPGGDPGNWGTMLNAFLEVAHNTNGTLKSSAIVAAGAGTFSKPASGIPATDFTSSVQAELTLASTSLQLGGDIGGTTTSPSVSKLQGTTLDRSSPSNGQVLAYNATSNSWIPSTVSSTTINDATSSTPGLIQLDGDLGNTATTPEVVSTHLSSPLPLAQGGTGASTQNFVDLSSNQTIAGTKTFNSAIAGNITGNAATVTTNANLTGDVTSVGNATTVAKIKGVSTPSVAPATGQVLTATSNSASAWSTLSSAPVSSVFGRTGVVTATSGDYTATQVGALPSTDDLSAITTANPTTNSWSNNSKKITNIANGSTATDAAAYGQIPTAGTGSTNYTAGNATVSGDLTGALPNPTVAKLNGITAPASAPSGAGQVLTSTSSSASAWSTPASAPVNSVFGRTGVVVASSGDYTVSQVTGAAPLSGPTFTGTPLAPTATTGTNTTQLATTAFVGTAVSNGSAANATSSTPGLVQLDGDLGNSATSPEVVSTHLSSPLPIGQGGTGSATQNFVSLAGDLGNSVATPRVESIQGVSISGTPSANQVLTASNSSTATWASPASAPVSSVFGRTGVVVSSSGDYTASQVTNAADKSSGSTQTFTANLSAPALSASGITGATAASRYVGATTSGAPASGTFALGDFVIDQTAKIWVCTTAGAIGSGGVFTQVTGGGGSSPVSSVFGRTGAVTATTGDYTASQVTGAAALDSNTRLAPADRDNVSAIFSADQTPSTLTNGTTYRYNCSSSSISQTLPTTPTVGTTLSFKRTDSVAANTLSLVAGGSDTFGESSPTAIGGAQSITYVYGSDSAWHATSSLLPIANLLTTSIASTLYTPLGIPAFQGNYQYVAGQLAVYEDELYLATNTFTSTSTFNSSNWYLVGSSSNITLDTTASDIQPIGNLLAGSTGDAADAGHVHPASSWLPADSGLKAWSFDPANISNLTTATTGGAVVFAKVRIALAQTVSYVWFNIATAAVNANSSGTECGVAIYDATGGSTQYGASGTGTAATAFGTSGGGLVSVAISTPVVLQPAIYTVAWWCNVTGGGSQPIFSRGASSTGINGSQTGSSARFGNAQTSVTSTPSLLSSMAAGQTAWWVALS